jgi:nudix-type nucleoside diphosphatase (YffH/AdpP family)
MAAESTEAGGEQPRVVILEEVEDYHYRRFSIWRARLQYRRSDGKLSEPATRVNFERGDAAAVLLHDPEDDRVLLVRQFRYPVYTTLPANARQDAGAEPAWLLEIIAGMIEEGQAAADVARREAEEETGYEVTGDLHLIAEVFVSPGASSERVTIFLGQTDSRHPKGHGGGLAAEGEDTEIVWVPRAEALDWLARGEIHDAKTMIALQYLALHGPGSP